MAKIDEYPFGKLTIQLHAVTTDPPAPHPHIAPNVPANFHILGVGAAVDPPDAASFLTAMWPVSSSEWDVAAKDHIVPSPARVTAFCIAARSAMLISSNRKLASACSRSSRDRFSATS